MHNECKLQGRPNVSEIKKMLLYLREHNDASDESNHITTSLEVEKPERYSELSKLIMVLVQSFYKVCFSKIPVWLLQVTVFFKML